MTASEKFGLWIAGQWTEPQAGRWFETKDPATKRTLALVARASREDVDRAVTDAARAYSGWSDLIPAERGRILQRFAAGIRQSARSLAEMETYDNGKPLRQSVNDVETTARYFEYYAGAADKIHGETIPLGPDYLAYTRREPFGVIGAILPWNVPMNQAGRAVAPALAAGNTVVVKPAEDTPLTCLRLAEIAVENGLPPGVFNVVPGFGREAGEALATHPLVRKIAFTGSLETGQRLMRLAADRMVPLTLELGGKSPCLVFADADLDQAAADTVKAINFNSGQVCSAPSRMLVAADVYDDVLERVVQLSRDLTLGHGLDNPDLGPLTTAAQYDKVRRYLALGEAEGASLAAGGAGLEAPGLEDGFFVRPTVFAGVQGSMRIAQEEIFGPVLSVIKVASEQEAIAVANGTAYGLVAGIWTHDLARAHRVAAQLEAGQVFVNEWYAGGVETPFGGYRASGYGREKGLEALAHYTQLKAVNVRL